MNIEKKDLGKSQIELNVELSVEEFKPYIEKGAIKISKEVKIEGFRPGKVPFDVLKQKIGEMSILEESARIAIDKTLGDAIKNNVDGRPVGSPKVDIVKLAPNNPLVYKVVLAMLPELKLGEYKGLKIKQQVIKITDKDTARMIDDLREMRAKEVAVDREIKIKDKVLLDIQMFLDKVPLEGGQNKDTAVIIGKDFIVPGFDKQLVGTKKGEVKEFSMPYPKDFHMKNLAGKMVEFKVNIKDVFDRELPELNDEFAKGFGVKKIEELRENIKKSIREQKEQERSRQDERTMLEKVISKTRFGDIPEILVESETRSMLQELEQTVQSRGGKFEDYLTSLSKTRDQLTLDMLPEAVKRVKISLLVREVSQLEKIKVSPEEMDKQLQNMKEMHKDNKETMVQLNTPEYIAYLNNVMTSQKVVEKLKEWNIVK